MKRYRLVLCGTVLFALLLISSTAFTQAPPSSDTYASSSSPDTNYGNQGLLLVTSGVTSYARFDLSHLPPSALVRKATLRLFVSGSIPSPFIPGRFDIFLVDSPWNELTMTYNTAPPLGLSVTNGQGLSVTSDMKFTYMFFDITDLVQGWIDGTKPNNGLAFVLLGNSGRFWFDSKESAATSHQTELEVVLESPQGPPGPQGPQGDQGAMGLQGPQGPQGDPGAAGANGQGFTFRNAFDNGTNYSAYDVVAYSGSTYDATVAIPAGGGTPDQNPNWSLMAQVGTQGQQGTQGLQGPQGDQGAQGATGLQGPQGQTGATGTTGASGPQGPAGSDGTNGTNGTGFTFHNAFDSGTNYAAYDVVTYSGSTYDATVAIPSGGGTPDTNPNWSLMAQVGAQGQQGAQGSQGSQGSQGPQGDQGPQGLQGDPGNLNPGSPYYVNNSTTPQSATSFNIDGTGTVGGTLAANAVDSHTNYLIQGNVVLSVPSDGNFNTFLGLAAGVSNTTGLDNTFIGRSAGTANTSGTFNTSIGQFAAGGLTTGSFNLFLGNGAGTAVTTGSSNIYVGAAGDSSAESNTIRIGTAGDGNGLQNTVYIAGIANTAIPSGSPVYVDAGGKLGVGSGNNRSVTSFNGRIDAVVPQSGDYDFSLLSGTLASGQLSGSYSSAVTLSDASNSFTGNGAGLTNVPVAPGSPNYIQNGSGQQTSASFNIDGTGTVAGTLAANAFNSTTDYQINGNTVLSVPTDGNYNTFLGLSAGSSNTSGLANTFIGRSAGTANTTGQFNTAIGQFAGGGITTGTSNTIIGNGSGTVVTTGNSNIYISSNAASATESNTIRIGTQGNGEGHQGTTYIAGISGTTVSGGSPVFVDENGLLGTGGGSTSVTSFNSRFGNVLPAANDYDFLLLSGRVGTTQLGGAYTNPVTLSSSDNNFAGNGAGLFNVPVSASSPYYIQNGTSQQAGSSFNIDGSATVGTSVNAGNYGIGGVTVLTLPAGTDGSVLSVGPSTPTVSSNSESTFVGYQAGASTSGANWNTFVGSNAGVANSTGQNNTLLGTNAGQHNSTGEENTLVGSSAASNVTTGANNTVIGNGAGTNLQTGGSDIYIGNQGGTSSENNTIRIGTQGSGNGQQNVAYMAGVSGSAVSSGLPVYVDSTGKLGTAGGNTSGVTSFNTRTGAVVPVSGDYGFSLLSGTLASAQFSGTYSSPLSFSNVANTFTGASFSVSGNGTAAGTLTGTTAVNTSGAYQFGGNTILKATSNGFSTFVGQGAGSLSTANDNTFVGYTAGIVSSGTDNTFIGFATGQSNGSGSQNTVLGSNAGSSILTSSDNTFLGYQAGKVDTAGTNTFVGSQAGTANTSGSENTLVGYLAGAANTTGSQSTFVGNGAGRSTTTGGGTFFGYRAGFSATTPIENTFIGFKAGLSSTTGDDNTFLGFEAGQSVTTGFYNLLIGWGAGIDITTGSSNIYVGHQGSSAAENNAIRIGTNGSGNAQQNTTFIAGIQSANVSGSTVLINTTTGQLGISTSSRRFKQDILDMGGASSKLLQLRPVTFFYKPQYDDGSHLLQYGLIAEEVAKIYPDLVAYDKDGQPFTVRYQLLTPMLLNELQKQSRVVIAQQDVINAQQQQIDDMQKQNAEFQRRLSRLEALSDHMGQVAQ